MIIAAPRMKADQLANGDRTRIIEAPIIETPLFQPDLVQHPSEFAPGFSDEKASDATITAPASFSFSYIA
jgi:hypothetical protein